MSDGHDIIRRLTEGDKPSQMGERHDAFIRQVEAPDSPNPLQQIVEDLKRDLTELVPVASQALRKYVGSKGEEAVARVQEIKARIYENIGRLEIERQRLLKERDDARQKYDLEAKRDENMHNEKWRELKSQGLSEVVDCILKLQEKGIPVDKTIIKAVERAMRERLKGK